MTTFHQRHAEACALGQDTYVDPRTGYQVFTAVGLQKRPDCCGCGCRHCPFGHEQVPPQRRALLPRDPWLERNTQVGTACDVLSWSGGKDSFLALVSLARQRTRDVVLLTTFDGRTGQVAHQDIHIDDVRAQAKTLSINLMLTPLYPETPYVERIQLALRLLGLQCNIHRFVFGDLHLEHVRQWRTDNLGPVGEALSIDLHFPLWKTPYAALEEALFASGATATISAVSHPELNHAHVVGHPVTSDWLDTLPEDVDRFGEHGEYHTLVHPPSRTWRQL